TFPYTLFGLPQCDEVELSRNGQPRQFRPTPWLEKLSVATRLQRRTKEKVRPISYAKFQERFQMLRWCPGAEWHYIRNRLALFKNLCATFCWRQHPCRQHEVPPF